MPTPYEQFFKQGQAAGLTPEQISQQFAQQSQAGTQPTIQPIQQTQVSGATTTTVAQPTQPEIQPTTPTTETQPTTQLTKAQEYKGYSIVDYLNLAGQPSDFTSRTKLATEKGIQNYTGTASQNLQLLNTLRTEATKTQPTTTQQTTETTEQSTEQSQQTEAKTGEIVDTTKSDTDVNNTFSSLTDKNIFGENKSITDVIKEVSKAFGLTEVDTEIAKIDDKFIEESSVINTDPWISESTRQRRVNDLQSKYENKRNALVDRLKLQQDIVGKSIEYYYKERDYKKDLLFKQLDLASKNLDEKKYQTGLVGEYQFYSEQEQAAGRQPVSFTDYQTLVKGKTGREYETGIIGEYQFYSEQERAAGREPMGFNEYQTMDANRKAKAAAAVNTYGLDAKQTQNFLRISDNFQKDEIIKNGDKSVSTIAIADQVLANPSKASNQLKALYTLVKALDPDSAVREGEISLAQQTQSYLGRFQSSLERVYQGQVIAPDVAKELAIATKELASTWQDAATRRTQKYKSQANVAGVGDAFGTYLQGSVVTPTITSAPQAPTYKQVEGVPEEPASIIQHNLDTGATLEEIRQGLSSLYGRDLGYQYLDKYIGQ